MIDPQLPSVKQAYEPWLYSERMMFLDGSLDDPILDRMPDAADESWIWVIDLDHDTTLIHVCVKNYVSLSEARRDLIERLMNHKKVLKCGGVTDMISESNYQIMSRTSQDWEYSVNSDCDLEGDVSHD